MGKVEHINNYKGSYVWLMSKVYGKLWKSRARKASQRWWLESRALKKECNLDRQRLSKVQYTSPHRLLILHETLSDPPTLTEKSDPPTLQKKDALSFTVSYSSSTFPVTDIGVPACARREGTAVKRAQFLLSRSSLMPET